MKDMMREAKAKKLKELIQMMGRDFMGEMEENEEKEPHAEMVEIEVKTKQPKIKMGLDEPDDEMDGKTPMTKPGGMKKMPTGEKYGEMSEMMKPGQIEMMDKKGAMAETGEDDLGGINEEHMGMKDKLMKMGMDEEEVENFLEDLKKTFRPEKPKESKHTKFVTMKKGIGEGMPADKMMSGIREKMKKRM